MEYFAIALRNSHYLEPAQKLLNEVVCVSNAVEPGLDEQMRKVISTGMTTRSSGRYLELLETMNPDEENGQQLSEEKDDAQVRITKLVALLNELENRYKHYLHQIDGVVSSFEAIAGTGAAASYTALTIQAMSKHFSNLRDAIITQVRSLRESRSEDLRRNHHRISQQRLSDKSSGQRKENSQHHSTTQQQPVCRPFRGLPETSSAVLRAWLFEHFLHPYPNDNEKFMLASQTGLTRNQISNWFINARVRLWKPMIEEMYKEETAEDSKNSNLSL